MNSRRTLLVLMLLFFAPLGLSFAMYYGWHWRPPGQTNHGTLIQPPRELPTTGAATVLSGKWSMVYVGAGDCDADCHSSLYVMRQTQLGLGHEIPRVQRVFLATGTCCDRAFLEREHAGLITLAADNADGAALLARFPADQRATTLFIVDPKGNLMMRYDIHANPKGLHEDLVKLLALSHIG
ncbi:MAG TPA: hypothetical protein VGH84_02375 [Steroidobacteraceae bacterium]|jgi:hypothetical protein